MSSRGLLDPGSSYPLPSSFILTDYFETEHLELMRAEVLLGARVVPNPARLPRFHMNVLHAPARRREPDMAFRQAYECGRRGVVHGHGFIRSERDAERAHLLVFELQPV